MADTVAVPAPAPADAAPGRRRKLVMVVLAVVGLTVAAVVVRTFLLSPPAEDAPAPAPEEGAVVTIGEMTASLAGGGNYARVELAAVANAEVDAGSLEARFPLMRDQALSVLMGFSAERLRTVEGADELRSALTERAQVVWEDQQVLRVVLTDLLVQ